MILFALLNEIIELPQVSGNSRADVKVDTKRCTFRTSTDLFLNLFASLNLTLMLFFSLTAFWPLYLCSQAAQEQLLRNKLKQELLLSAHPASERIRNRL